MKKFLLLTLAIFSMAWNAQAIRPIRKAELIKQSDGTTVHAFKHGDQYCAYYTTLDGKVLYSNIAGDLCYARLEKGELVATDMIAHDLQLRTTEEKAFIESLQITEKTPEVTKLAMRKEPRKIISASTPDGLGKKGQSALGAVNSIGEIKVPVILVSYTDVDFMPTSTIEKYDRYFNKEGYDEEPNTVGSVRDYYLAQSNGMFSPKFEIVAKVKLSQNRAYYGANKNGKSGNDVRAGEMIKEAIKLAKQEKGDTYFDQFVVDGAIQNVTVLYAGEGEANYGAPAEAIWPHEFDINQNIEGYLFKSYFVGNEVGASANTMAGIGVFCHEFGHALGLPDFYPTNYNYDDDFAFGSWSLMEAGCYVHGGNAPIGMMAYERSYLGWLDIPALQEEGNISLDDINKKDGVPARLIRNPNNQMEYFIVENRQVGTWYPKEFGSGLMLTHFCYDKFKWMYNTVNNIKNSKRAHIVTADGSKIGHQLPSQAHFFGNGVPNIESARYKLYFGSTLANSEIYKVMEHGDGTITFNFRNKDLADSYEVLGTEIFEKVTDVSNLKNDDRIIFVNEEAKMAMTTKDVTGKRTASTMKVSNNSNFITDNNAEILTISVNNDVFTFKTTENRYLGMKRAGMTTSSSINENSKAKIEINNGEATVKFTGRYKKYIAYDSDKYLFFATTTEPVKLQIYRSTNYTNSIEGIETQPDNSVETIYNLNGQRVERENMQRGIYIINGKKVMVK